MNFKKQIQHTPKLDPTNEYYRICKYIQCQMPFTADHMLREYCPEKNGMKDYCKNRQKRINDAEEAQTIKASRNSRSNIKGNEPPSELPVGTTISTPQIKAESLTEGEITDKKNCVEFLKQLLGNKEVVEVSLEFLSEIKFQINSYDRISSLPNTNNNKTYAEYGDYAVIWESINTVSIIHLKNLLWLTQFQN